MRTIVINHTAHPNLLTTIRLSYKKVVELGSRIETNYLLECVAHMLFIVNLF